MCDMITFPVNESPWVPFKCFSIECSEEFQSDLLLCMVCHSRVKMSWGACRQGRSFQDWCLSSREIVGKHLVDQGHRYVSMLMHPLNISIVFHVDVGGRKLNMGPSMLSPSQCGDQEGMESSQKLRGYGCVVMHGTLRGVARNGGKTIKSWCYMAREWLCSGLSTK